MKALLANPGYDFEYYITGVIDGRSDLSSDRRRTASINKTVVISLPRKFVA